MKEEKNLLEATISALQERQIEGEENGIIKGVKCKYILRPHDFLGGDHLCMYIFEKGSEMFYCQTVEPQKEPYNSFEEGGTYDIEIFDYTNKNDRREVMVRNK